MVIFLDFDLITVVLKKFFVPYLPFNCSYYLPWRSLNVKKITLWKRVCKELEIKKSWSWSLDMSDSNLPFQHNHMEAFDEWWSWAECSEYEASCPTLTLHCTGTEQNISIKSASTRASSVAVIVLSRMSKSCWIILCVTSLAAANPAFDSYQGLYSWRNTMSKLTIKILTIRQYANICIVSSDSKKNVSTSATLISKIQCFRLTQQIFSMAQKIWIGRS